MNSIQLILLASTLILGLVFALQLKKRVLDILLLLVLIGVGILFILWPGLTNIIANKLGVGRGADLIFYISILVFWFIILKLFSRIRKIEQKITDVIRQDAIRAGQFSKPKE